MHSAMHFAPDWATGPITKRSQCRAATSPAIILLIGITEYCGQDTRDVAGVPVDDIQHAVDPNDAQHAALGQQSHSPGARSETGTNSPATNCTNRHSTT
jgi:hypothetical protein